jgi:hypothetical protein
MRNVDLVKLNFHDQIDYGGQPTVQHKYSTPLACEGYCVHCDLKGLLKDTSTKLDLMSHGCDSEDFARKCMRRFRPDRGFL